MIQAFQLIVFLPSVADALAQRGVTPSRPLEAHRIAPVALTRQGINSLANS